MPTPLALRRQALQSRLADLKHRLTQIEGELASHHDADWEELAVEREGDEVLEATGRAGQIEIPLIEAALRRIDDGTYGECVQCGDRIDEARLDTLPWTPFCRSCAP